MGEADYQVLKLRTGATQLKTSPVITVEIPTRIHPGLLAEAFPSSLRKGETLWQTIVDDEACTDTT